ncbi:hypothetical protein SOVF_202750, partial [Spinacia oleracea]
MGLDQE